MFVFGHIGIGRKLASPWSRDLPHVPLIAGMLLPDLIDKPLYYARLWDYVSCTRTFGHTGLLLLLLLLCGYLLRSRALLALGLGDATHLLLDWVIDGFGHAYGSSTWMAFTWPILYGEFAYYFSSLPTHAGSFLIRPVVATEVIGLALIAWDFARQKLSGARAGRSGRGVQ
jgi:hypothetical protein